MFLPSMDSALLLQLYKNPPYDRLVLTTPPLQFLIPHLRIRKHIIYPGFHNNHIIWTKTNSNAIEIKTKTRRTPPIPQHHNNARLFVIAINESIHPPHWDIDIPTTKPAACTQDRLVRDYSSELSQWLYITFSSRDLALQRIMSPLVPPRPLWGLIFLQRITNIVVRIIASEPTAVFNFGQNDWWCFWWQYQQYRQGFGLVLQIMGCRNTTKNVDFVGGEVAMFWYCINNAHHKINSILDTALHTGSSRQLEHTVITEEIACTSVVVVELYQQEGGPSWQYFFKKIL